MREALGDVVSQLPVLTAPQTCTGGLISPPVLLKGQVE